MKAIKLFTAVILAACMLVMSVFAAEFVPSIEQKDGVELVSYVLEEIDTPCRTVYIIPYGHTHLERFIFHEEFQIEEKVALEMEEAIRESLKAAMEELKDNLIHHLVPGFDEAWEKVTGGAPLDNAIVHEIFEIVLICSQDQEFKTDEKLTVSFTVEGIGPDDAFVIVHKPTGSDEWIVEEHEIDENGVITIHPDKLSPFAIIKDSGAAPVIDPDAPDSPQTGVEEGADRLAAALIGGTVLAFCGILAARSRSKKAAR